MLGEHHNLINEFPEYKDKIHTLKMENSHFRKLMDEHHELDKEIRRIEEQQEAVCDENLEDLKKQRLAVQDSIYSMLTKA